MTTDFALNWLKESQENAEKPFMLMLQYKAPHRKWIREQKYNDLFDNIEMPYPATFWDDYKGREKTAGDTDMTMDNFDPRDMKLTPPDSLTDPKAIRRWGEMGYKRGTGEGWLPSDTMTIEEARKWKYQRYIKDYLSCVRSVDDQIGRVLAYLDESGLSENTVVIYTSDQGFYLGDHGWYDKRFMYEQSLRMPFIIKYPGELPAGTTNSDLITNVDFAPTLIDFAGINTSESLQGKSFRKNLTNSTDGNWRPYTYYHYYEYPFWHHVQPHYGVRDSRYKLIHFYYDMDQWELYDLEEDPDELQNLYDDPAYQDVVARMKSALIGLQKQYGDDISLDSMRVITKQNFGLIGGGNH